MFALVIHVIRKSGVQNLQWILLSPTGTTTWRFSDRQVMTFIKGLPCISCGHEQFSNFYQNTFTWQLSISQRTRATAPISLWSQYHAPGILAGIFLDLTGDGMKTVTPVSSRWDETSVPVSSRVYYGQHIYCIALGVFEDYHKFKKKCNTYSLPWFK
jgi:hypothetical protein